MKRGRNTGALAAGPIAAATPNDGGGAENRGRAERRRSPQDPAAGPSAAAAPSPGGGHERRGRPGEPRALVAWPAGRAAGEGLAATRTNGDGRHGRTATAASGAAGGRRRQRTERADVKGGGRDRSKQRGPFMNQARRQDLRCQGRCHAGATLDACPDLGAMTGGAKTCYLGATICGANPQSPETQIVSKKA